MVSSEWRLILGEKEYPTPYANIDEWKQAMEERSKTDTARMAGNPFKGSGYDLVSAILDSQK